MSFLNFKIPVESLDSVLEEIRRQITAGRLEASSSFEGIGKATIEIKRLKEIIEREFQIDKAVGLVAGLVKVEYNDRFDVWELIADDGSCFIICIKEFPDGGAFWTDLTRECLLDHKTILKCSDGHIEAKEKGCGGDYLLLIHKPSQLAIDLNE